MENSEGPRYWSIDEQKTLDRALMLALRTAQANGTHGELASAIRDAIEGICGRSSTVEDPEPLQFPVDLGDLVPPKGAHKRTFSERMMADARWRNRMELGGDKKIFDLVGGIEEALGSPERRLPTIHALGALRRALRS